MPDGWEWDETLFAGTAPHYLRGRLPYGPGLAGLLAEVLALDGRGRLIDVGTGPGVPALSLVSLFAEVVGVDPDGAMIEEARRRADEAGLAGKTRWVRARAEDLPAGLGTFSRSDSAPHLFGDRRAEFEADLDRLLSDVSPAGRFFEPQPGTEVMIWRLRTATTPRC